MRTKCLISNFLTMYVKDSRSYGATNINMLKDVRLLALYLFYKKQVFIYEHETRTRIERASKGQVMTK
jgi:hypothetical protein